MKEYYQVYDSNLNTIDLKIERPNYVPDGYYFGVVDVVTYNINNDSFLMTRRSKNKRSLPGLLEVTCGCMQYGEDPLYSAKRELKEETGITPLKIKNYKSYLYRHAVTHINVAVCNIEPDSVVLQEGETEAYYWYKEEDFKKMWESSFVTEVQKGRILPNIDDIINNIKAML